MKSFFISVLLSFTGIFAFAQWQTGGTLQVFVKGDLAILINDIMKSHYNII